MRPILLPLCLWACAAVLPARGADAPAPPQVQLVLDLTDGSHIIGTPSLDKLKIATKYAALEVPLAGIRAIEFRGAGADRSAEVSLQNGDHVSGDLAATEIAVKALFGDITIPMAKILTLRVRHPGQAMPEGLVLHYTFDEDEGGKVTDASGNGNDGTVRGATFTKEGKIGGAMSFNGQSQEVLVGNPSSLRLQDFTIMAWIKRGDPQKVSVPAQDGQIFGYGDQGYILGLHNDGKLFISKVDVGGVFSSCEIHDTDFHHVVLVKKGAKIVFYLDGTAYPAADYGDTFEFHSDAAVGARSDHQDGSFLDGTFLGVIDDVAVFNRALSDDEIKSVYDSQK